MQNAATNKEFTKGEFKPITAGDYLLRMTRVEEVDTRNGGRMVKATFQVVNGDAKNRLIFESFLTQHGNPTAEKIGKERLSKFLQAVGENGGLEGIGNDTTQLENYLELPFIGSVKIEAGSEYTDKDGNLRMSKDRNKITSFKSR